MTERHSTAVKAQQNVDVAKQQAVKCRNNHSCGDGEDNDSEGFIFSHCFLKTPACITIHRNASQYITLSRHNTSHYHSTIHHNTSHYHSTIQDNTSQYHITIYHNITRHHTITSRHIAIHHIITIHHNKSHHHNTSRHGYQHWYVAERPQKSCVAALTACLVFQPLVLFGTNAFGPNNVLFAPQISQEQCRG